MYNLYELSIYMQFIDVTKKEEALLPYLPIKSMMSRPSQALPEGCPKKVSPLGVWISDKAAEMPPVSEFESPKLYIAGKSHLRPPPPTTNTGNLTWLTTNTTNTQHSLIESMVFLATSYQKVVCTHSLAYILVCFYLLCGQEWVADFVVFLIHDLSLVTDKFWNQDFDRCGPVAFVTRKNNYVMHQIHCIFLLAEYML